MGKKKRKANAQGYYYFKEEVGGNLGNFRFSSCEVRARMCLQQCFFLQTCWPTGQKQRFAAVLGNFELCLRSWNIWNCPKFSSTSDDPKTVSYCAFLCAHFLSLAQAITCTYNTKKKKSGRHYPEKKHSQKYLTTKSGLNLNIYCRVKTRDYVKFFGAVFFSGVTYTRGKKWKQKQWASCGREGPDKIICNKYIDWFMWHMPCIFHHKRADLRRLFFTVASGLWLRLVVLRIKTSHTRGKQPLPRSVLWGIGGMGQHCTSSCGTAITSASCI